MSRPRGSVAQAASPLTVALVGRFRVVRQGIVLDDSAVGTRKARRLLAVLAVNAREVVDTDFLAEVIWGDRPPTRPVDNLATFVSRIRGSLGEAVVAGDRAGWALGPGATTDLLEAEALVAEAQHRQAAVEPALAVTAANAALTHLGSGRLLVDDPSAWADDVRNRVSTLLRTARLTAASARLSAQDSVGAAEAADSAIAADPFDEQAVRLAMRAHATSGQPARGLAAFERLRSALAQELGVDPAPETRELHTALLREQDVATATAGLPSRARPRGSRIFRPGSVSFVGRDSEMSRLISLWSEVVEGATRLAVVVGEPGIGKTRLAGQLAHEAHATGGHVLEARCHAAERSLFLQPFVDVVRPELLRLDPATARALAGDRAASLATLVPDVGDLLGSPPREPATPDTARRMAYEAVSGFLERLAARAPLLIILDDAHHAGASSVELLHLMARRAAVSPLLVVATVRTSEGSELLSALAQVATQVDVGLLDERSVLALASERGFAAAGPGLVERTRGHPLFVIESLRALEAGESGVPASLAFVVDSQVSALAEPEAVLLRAASVLGSAFDPKLLAALVERDPVPTVQSCERLVASHLLVRSGSSYSFTNDLVQEAVYAGSPPALRQVFHQRAADLVADRPEECAVHASAAGETARASAAWLAAGLEAAHRYASADAEVLLTRAVSSADAAGSNQLRARSRLERGRLRVTRSLFPDALTDFTDALALVEAEDLAGLEMLVRRELGGDVLVALGRPISGCDPHLAAGLRAARALHQPVLEVDLLARSAVIATNRLQFVRAERDASEALALARTLGDPLSMRLALDGLRNVRAYLGDLPAITEITAELEPLTRQAGDLNILQWTLFERSFVPLAAGEWSTAEALVMEALDVCRRTGWTAYEPWFLSHLGWIARVDGRLDDAVQLGRQAVELGAGATHPWWLAISCSLLASSLLVTDETSSEAVRLLRRGLAVADPAGVEAYRFRCLAGIAAVTGADEARDQAQLLLDEMQLPPGQAWLHGTDAMVLLARAWLRVGRPDRAEHVLHDLAQVGTAGGWSAFLVASGVVDTLARARAMRQDVASP